MPVKSELVRESAGNEAYEYYPLGEHVVRAPGVCGGEPTFKYTRFEITGTLDRLASGEPLHAILSGYKGRVSPALQRALTCATKEAHKISTLSFAP